MHTPLFSLPSFRRQNLYLALALALALTVIVRYNIGHTLSLRRQCQALEQRAAEVERAPALMAGLKADLRELTNTALRPYDRGYLLDKLSDFCRENAVLIRNFPEERRVQVGNYTVVTNEVEVEGDYSAIVQLAYRLEREERLGNINSLRFFRYEDRYERTSALRCRIILRNIAH